MSTPTVQQTGPGRGRRRARKGDGARLRQEILDAASDLLIQTGDQSAVSIRAVAAKVGVTPPSIYLHFADKGELIFQCCSHLMSRQRDMLRATLTESDDPFERLRLAARYFVRFGMDNPEPYRIMLMSPHTQVPDDLDTTSYGGTLAFNAVKDLIADALGSEAGDDPDVALSAMALVTAVHGITSMMVAKAIEPIDFPWPEVDVLLDRVLDIHLADLRQQRASRLEAEN